MLNDGHKKVIIKADSKLKVSLRATSCVSVTAHDKALVATTVIGDTCWHSLQ